ncbi:TonB-dependent receptor [Croceibacterium sp. TMG7-5b_MA50]|uniref:TonB-dependent receptor n=1 Tax=Croceibacterium sp. TMG7-5b_MA50 TaxID=3121290 RepID=UPI0032221F98
MIRRYKVLAGVLAGSTMFGMTGAAHGQAASTPAGEPTVEGEAIVVTGLRESLANAAQTKRNTLEVVDSITADDIGKLPDPNVAETLTRIPGVQGYRFGGETASPVGEGSGLTIRGLSNLTASRIDGRAFFTAGSREFNIEGAIPGIVAGLDVFKNPTAEHIEGAIGGLINIRTRKPLDFRDDLAGAAGATLRYNDLAENVRPEYFGLISKKFDLGAAGELGILVAGSYQQSFNRGDSTAANGGLNLRRAISGNSAEYAANPSLNRAYVGRADVSYLLPVSLGEALAMSEAQRGELFTAVTDTHNVFTESYERTRKGLNIAVQWEPSSNLEVNLTGLYNSYLYDQDYQFIVTSNSSYVQNLSTLPFTVDEGLANRNANGGPNELVAGRRIAGGTFLNSGLFTQGGDEHRLYETGIIAANVVWRPTDRLMLSTDISYVDASQSQDNRSVRLDPVAGLSWNITRDIAAVPHGVQFEGPDLSSPANFVFNNYSNGTNQTFDDDGLAARFDAEYELPDGPLRTIRAGLRYAYQADRYRNYTFDRQLTTNGLAPAADGSNRISAAAFQDLLALAPDNFLDHEGGYAGGFLTFDPQALLGDNVRARFSQAGILPEDSLAENLISRRYFKEDTYAAYAEADYALLDDRLRGNIGVRVVRTDIFARGQVRTASGDIVPVESSSDYTNVLPSFNAVYNLTPDTLLRFGYGRGLTRPSFSNLNPQVIVTQTTGFGTQGNPDLRPQVGESVDIALEHYFTGGSYVAVNGFYKWIDGFFTGIEECQTVPLAPAPATGVLNSCPAGQYRITRNVNASAGNAKGVEVAGQTFFDFDFVPPALHGFGASASFTYVDTEVPVTLNGQEIVTQQPFTSKYNYSLTGLYEDDLIQARVVYTWRSDHILFGVTGNPIDGRYIKGFGVLDASIGVNLTEALSLNLQASNLLDTAPNRYVGEPNGYATPIERQHFTNGRVFGASVRYSFGS